MSQTPGPTTRLRSSRQNTPLPVTAPSGTKQKPTALPAATVGISSGYGAPGKPVIRTQIATETTNLTTLLQNAREAPPAAIEEDEEIEVDATASKTPFRRTPGRLSNHTGRLSNHTGRQRATGSMVNGDAEMPPPPRPPPSRRGESHPTFIDPIAGYGGGGIPEYEPDNITLAAHTLPRYIPQVLRDFCLLYTSPSPRDGLLSRMPSSA